jgi:hypothetical protein
MLHSTARLVKHWPLLKLDNDFYDNFILGFGQRGILISHLRKALAVSGQQRTRKKIIDNKDDKG